MQRHSKTLQDAVKLVQLIELISSTSRTLLDEWAKEASTSLEERKGEGSQNPAAVAASSSGKEWQALPSRSLYQAQRTLLAAGGVLTELVSEPSNRLFEVSSSYFEARALHVATEKRIADMVAGVEGGVEVAVLAKKTGIEWKKLSRLLRCLCSIQVFEEVRPDCFANNAVSAALVGNEPLRAYILMFGLDLYSASDHLPTTLSDLKKGPSYDVSETAFQNAVGTSKPRWEWLEEKVPIEELKPKNSGYPGIPGLDLTNESKSSLVPRPELGVFGLAMLGGGRVFGVAHIHDYPWASLGEALLVDVGGGVGGFSLQLSHLYPDLRFTIQDRAAVLKQAQEEVWPKEHPEALKHGRVSFTQHDFFQENPVKGADIYWLRYILHDWSDTYCIKILTAIRKSMSPSSRILICDQVMNTTLGCPELAPAPRPLPANYGSYTRYSHQRDLAMMSIINGIERTPTQFREIVEGAGLRLHKIWECRSQVSLVELALP